MTKDLITNRLDISTKEVKKSARDTVVMGGIVGITAALESIIPVVEKLGGMDFGQNTFIYSFIISAVIVPLLNRYLNILRVK